MRSLMVIAHALLLSATVIMGFERNYCPPVLPQNSRGLCLKNRQAGLIRQRSTFQLNPPSLQNGKPFARLNMNESQYMTLLKTRPYLLEHATLRYHMSVGVRKATVMYQHITRARPEEMTINEYVEMYHFYRSVLEKALGHKMRLPSKYELFQMDITKYLSDQLFAEQRLAGANPLILRQVTLSDEKGLKWNTLKKTLNPLFDVKKAIGNTLGRKIEDEADFESVIEDGLLFVLRYPVCDDMVFMEDIIDKNPNRTLWHFFSPIALFALVSKDDHKRNLHHLHDATLMPVAIQMDYKPDSKVYTPKDGGKWTLAKLNVQVTDFGQGQLVEHLGNTHFVAEAFCVSVERHLSHRHPLYAMLQPHCRGVFTTNTLGAQSLFVYMRKMFPFGSKGAARLLAAASQHFTWESLDLEADIEKRGVGELPYYPYRDDGKKVVKAIKEFVHDYVHLYYPSRIDVFIDKELQEFVKEISIEGNGKIRGFPTSVHSTCELKSILTRFIWTVSARHSAVSYPLTDYGYFVPNAPTKLYTDNREPVGDYSLMNLPSRSVAEIAEELASLLGTTRYDKLFDYGNQLEDREARRVVHQHYCKLYDELDPQLARENEKRYKEGHLTYPYFQPAWLTNGIQT